ncbi:hypothetical protein TNCV_923601 [Trichonephila clavipes]|nr:hypothetical protein TNCV_923601 [Trichonephila clavipes]
MKEELIALNYECSKCNERIGLYERKSAVLDGDFEWVCSTITSQNIYGRTPMILLTMRPSRLFVKIRCHAVASTRKRSAVRKTQIYYTTRSPVGKFMESFGFFWTVINTIRQASAGLYNERLGRTLRSWDLERPGQSGQGQGCPK